MKKCSLAEDINECQYFDKKNKECNNPGKCSFQEDVVEESINHQEYIKIGRAHV